MEIWKDVIGYEGRFQISNLGRLKSLNYNHTNKEGLLKPQIQKKGTKTDLQYCYFNTRVNGKPIRLMQHRLVAEAFIPNPENKPFIDHIDTNGLNNSLDNLRWCTLEENSNNELTKIHHIESADKKPVIQLTEEGEFIREWNSAAEVKKELGICNSNIKKCINGKRKTAGGFVWRYA